MKILIMGSGGVGGYFGAVLHRGGHEVQFVARGQHLQAIEQHGLRIESGTAGNFTIRPAVTERPDGSWKADLVLFCVKSYDNQEAIATMAPAVDEKTSVMSLQNGIGSGEELAMAFGPEKVLLGLTYVDAARKEPGVVVEVGGPYNIIFGEEDGRRTPRATAVGEALHVEGIDVQLSSNVVKELWNKLVFICSWSGMICITRSPMSEILETPETEALTRAALQETEAVARARGVDLEEDIVETTMAQFRKIGSTSTSSMFTDLQRGYPLEVGVLNGAVVRLGQEAGIATPVHEFIAACLTVAHQRAVSERA